MAWFKAFIVAAGAALASGELAQAADLPPAPRLPAPVSDVEDFSGWYLRGDAGAGINANPLDLKTAPDPIATGVSSGFLSSQASQAFNNTTLSPFGLIDVGAGYRFNSWFRVDGTLEYRAGANLQSLYTLTDPASPGFGGPAQFADFFRADVSSFIGLINGYVNLGTYLGVSPFIGAGFGFADNSVSGLTDQGIASSAYFSSPAGGYFSNGSKTSFAWALMAGLDFNITPNLRLEMGYRYLNYGSIGTGGSNCLAGGGGGTFSLQNCSGGVQNHLYTHNTLASNDIRVGLVWFMGEPFAAPGPIVTRY